MQFLVDFWYSVYDFFFYTLNDYFEMQISSPTESVILVVFSGLVAFFVAYKVLSFLFSSIMSL